MSEHELWNELGNLYFMSGTYNQAAYAYRRAIQLDSGFGRPYCNLALTYVKQGRFEEAVQLYQRSIELLVDETERAISWYRLGDVYRHLKDYRDAILAYQAADMLDAELSPKDKETDHILYGSAEVRLVQAGAVSPSIPETVPSPEAAVPQPEPEPPAVEELIEPVSAGAESRSQVSAEAADDVQEFAAPVSEAADPAPVEEIRATVEEIAADPAVMQDASAPASDLAAEMASAEETPAAISEEVALMAPVEEAPAAASETAADMTMMQDASAPAADLSAEMATAEQTPAAMIEEVTVTATAEDALAAAVETAADTAPAEEIAAAEVSSEAVEEIVETPLAIEEDSPELQVVLAVDGLFEAAASEPAFVESPAEAVPEVDLQAPEMAAEEPVIVEPETVPPTPGVEVAFVEEALTLNTAPAEEPGNDELTEAAASAAGWEEYVVSSMEQATDTQPLGDAEPALDAWLPELEMELPAGEAEQLVEEPAVLGQDPVSDDFPASAEAPFFPARFPSGTAGTFTAEDMLTAVPSVALDFREEDTQPIFIVPEEMEQGFSVVEVESGTTDVACAAKSEEADAEMQGILAEIERFKHAVQANPRNAPAWDTLGTLYKAARKYRDAIMAYQQAVSVDPSKPHYHHHLGILYAIEGREEDAVRAFQDVIELDPNHSLANATLGGYYRKMGLEELAQKHIGKAMKNFYTSENEYNRACLEALCGNTEQSLELLRIALKNKQTYVDWVLRDPDLDSIRRDPRFKQLISDYATW